MPAEVNSCMFFEVTDLDQEGLKDFPSAFCQTKFMLRSLLHENLWPNGCFLPISATASYRLLPEITIVKPCEDELADKLVGCFSDGVIKVEHQDGMSNVT